MARRRYVWDPKLGELVEVSTDHNQPPRSHYVIPQRVWQRLKRGWSPEKAVSTAFTPSRHSHAGL